MSDTLIGSSPESGRRYQPVAGHWDEVLLPSGTPRRHWRQLFVDISRMGMGQFDRRWKTGQQVIQTQGVTYNAGEVGESDGYQWLMDPIPFVLGSSEWSLIERSIAQRATLMNAMLVDLYGPQRLLRERLLPPELLFASPNFLRPCVGIAPSGGIHLHTYAADLARSPDGRWWVIADRTQVPSGMGYTLQNRLVSARTFPGLFSQYNVRQLARFFDAKREALLALAAGRRSNPVIVVLTPGPHNETYFEHSFLAGQWGFTLAEGADLTVADNRVYLKTLGGLKPVDLILRRMDDAFCDPLELRGDSLLGVPGLVQAVRSGNVLMDNSLGSGLVETAVHMAFLPGLCRELLGEELRMPSVATWWCGQAEPRRHVVEHLDDFVVKPAFPRFGRHAEFPESMDAEEKKRLLARIHARPDEFVAQERIALSTVPVRNGDGFVPRHAVLRVYAAWDGASYIVMPGGLTRISTEDSSFVVSMKSGGRSKDTWVIGGTHEPPGHRRQIPPHIDGVPVTSDLPSRLADNLFWMGRYTERVETLVRLVRALLPALSGDADFGRAASLETAIQLLAGMKFLTEDISSASLGEQRWIVQRVLADLVYDSTQTSGLRWNLREMRRSVRNLKERLSVDTWRVLQQLESQLSGFAPANPDLRYLGEMDLLDGAIVTLSAFSGLLMENTTRGAGWRFLEIGRRMERALQTVDLLRSGLTTALVDTEASLQVLLQIADSSITYRQRNPMALQVDPALDLLLIDETNPRSVGFQLAALLHQINRLQEEDEPEAVERRLALKLVNAVRGSRTADLSMRGGGSRFLALEELLQETTSTLWELSDSLTARYFSHLTASRLSASW